MPALLSRGRSKRRDQMRTLVTHFGLSDDTAAFADGQVRVNPTQGATAVVVAPVTREVDVDVDSVRFEVDVAYSNATYTALRDKAIHTFSLCDGATATDVLSRSVRPAGLGVGLIVGDTHTFSVTSDEEDNTP